MIRKCNHLEIWVHLIFTKKRMASMTKYTKLILLLLLFCLACSCHMGRFFYWNFADIKDYKKNPSLPVRSGGETFYFHESEKWFK